MKIAIVIPTYQRDDGKTPEYLTKCLLSIKNQIYQDYKIFLIGDKYENNIEFETIATSIIDSDKIYYTNLNVAVERERYSHITSGNTNLFNINSVLWRCGGANASNVGIEMALSEHFNYICAMDHDDTWESNHLKLINDYCETGKYVIIASKAHIKDMIPPYRNMILPMRHDGGEFYPEPCNIVHSSVCVDFSRIPFRYRDCQYELNIAEASDADLWRRMASYMKENNLKGFLIKEVTCNHN
jgi:glycosyltransferase involved in cell wall biosynthesis